MTDEELLAQCDVETFRSGGPGGQHQNTRESGVRLRHRPTGLVAISREERSQYRNKINALKRLRERLAERRRRRKPRVKTRTPRRAKEKRLTQKKQTGEKKRLRKSPNQYD